MLPKYEAIDFVDVLPENVGHTKPWVVMANTPYGLTPFVTKLYNTPQVDNFHRVTKEIVSNILAQQFDLSVPTCALIEISPDIIANLPPDAQLQYDDADPRPKFATVQISNASNAFPEMSKLQYQKRIQLDTLYAFDNLIRNHDRGTKKTNLLINPSDAFLIDHELTFCEQDIVDIDITQVQLEDRFTKHHLFFRYLKRSHKQFRQNFFNEFSLYLNNISTIALAPYFNQLVNEGFNDYSQPIINWLAHVRQNSNTFVDKLKGSLQ